MKSAAPLLFLLCLSLPAMSMARTLGMTEETQRQADATTQALAQAQAQAQAEAKTKTAPQTLTSTSVQSLTNDNIRFFYQQEADSYKWPIARFRTFMRASLTDNFISDSTTTVNFPGKPPQTVPGTQNKNSALSHAEGEYQMMQGARLAINLGAIQIAPDARSAVVPYHSEAHDIAFNYAGSASMSADSRSDCTDTLVLTDHGDIQIKNTKCVSTVDVVTGFAGGTR